MPPRALSVAIVGFWLATAGWLFHREVWPSLHRGELAPFTVDLNREARETAAAGRGGVEWDIFWKGRTVGHAWTKVLPRQGNYAIHTQVEFRDFVYDINALRLRVSVQLTRLDTRRWVKSNGDLLELRGEVDGVITALGGTTDGTVKWSGYVNNGEFQPHWSVSSPGLGKRELATEPVHVPNDYSTFNPMEPWNRLSNVVPGQRWRITRFDPLLGSVAAMAGASPRADYLEAGVLEQPVDFTWESEPTPCLVIEYHGENEVARTFVRQSDGLVLRQEVESQRPDLPDSDADKVQVFALQRTPPGNLMDPNPL